MFHVSHDKLVGECFMCFIACFPEGAAVIKKGKHKGHDTQSNNMTFFPFSFLVAMLATFVCPVDAGGNLAKEADEQDMPL